MRVLNLGPGLGATLLCLGIAAPASALIDADAGGRATVREFTGYAYDQKSSALLYTERHRQELQGNRLLRSKVMYTDPQGKVIARKTLDYSANPYAPQFRTEDLRTGSIEAGAFVDSQYTVSFRARHKENLRTRRLGEVKKLVADAGFDSYVRARMHELLKGHDVHFEFAVPSRLESIAFRAAPMGTELKDGRELLRIRAEVDNALLRLFVSPIFLGYDIKTGDLIEYIGLSNLDDSKGDKYRVRILYPGGQKSGGTAGGS